MVQLFIGALRTAGYVQVYKINSTGSSGPHWVQVGSTMRGKAVDDYFGFLLAMSGNGTTITIDAIGNDGMTFGGRHVRIYEKQRSTDHWVQVGDDIDSNDVDDESRWSIAMSADGKTVVVGAPYHAFNDICDYNGLVRVYTICTTSGQWEQIGSDIVGNLDQTGFTVAIAANGKTIAIGAPINDENGFNSGQIRVYSITSTPGRWTQVGADLNGVAADYRYGYSLAMSDDGKTIASVAFNSRNVRVYTFNASSNRWGQIGSDIESLSFLDCNVSVW